MGGLVPGFSAGACFLRKGGAGKRRRMRVLVVFGTRPEAIKLAPVILQLKKYPQRFEVFLAVTAQHRHMLDRVLSVFDLSPDFDLNIMRSNQSLADITTRTLRGIEKLLRKIMPDLVLVQGDTTTAFAAALAAYYCRVKVGHVEAGLRTGDKFAPYPEEINRRLLASLADVHFAPTLQARNNLLSEGVSEDAIYVTGNTVIDALQLISKKLQGEVPPELERLPLPSRQPSCRLILVTAHRRESFGPGLERVCEALTSIVRRNPDVEVVYPVHLNPNVRQPVRRALTGTERIHLVEPLDYFSFVYLMNQAYLILTDSGGIQEEAPALGKPVLVLRDKTERPEAVEAGTAVLVGTEPRRIVATVELLLQSKRKYQQMATAKNPFGDGRAAQRIVRILSHSWKTVGGAGDVS